MAVYNLSWKDSVYKDMRAIPKAVVRRIVRSAEGLAIDPLPSGAKKLRDVEHTYRLRVGDYRVIYQIDLKGKAILVCRVRHRKDAYRV